MQELQMPQNHQVVLNRFVAACQADERVVAAFLGGSYARGAADAYSDLDLYLITGDEAYDDFFAGHADFMHLLGEPVFLKASHDFGFDLILFIYADGTEGDLIPTGNGLRPTLGQPVGIVEGELGLGRESHFTHIHGGPYKILLDKKGILAGALFPSYAPDQTEQIEMLRDMIYWFWHNLYHHFMTPIARGQLWSAYGALEDLRLICVNLARLRQNFQAVAEGYEKIEQALPVEQLAPLEATFCAMERGAMLQAALVIVRFYQELAPPLAQAHDITYPADLDRMMYERLEQLRNAGRAR